jgi:hypothetical protein
MVQPSSVGDPDGRSFAIMKLSGPDDSWPIKIPVCYPGQGLGSRRGGIAFADLRGKFMQTRAVIISAFTTGPYPKLYTDGMLLQG